MAIGTAVYPGPSNTFVPNHEATGNLVISYSRNPNSFALPKYISYRPVKQSYGYYLKITAQEAARIIGGSLNDYVWADGDDRPTRHNGTESFAYADYRTTRYDFDFTLGYKSMQEADWDINGTHVAFKAQQAMTGRTVKTQSVLSTSGNWDSTHVSAVSAITGNSGSWEVSTVNRADIKRSLNYAVNKIRQDTLGVVKKADLHLVMNPYTAMKIGESQEVIDYVKSSPAAWPMLQGKIDGLNDEFNVPAVLYGLPVEIDDTVVVTSQRGDTLATSYAMANGLAYILARPGALVSAAASGPSFSTITAFLKEEMTVESLDDKNNRRTNGHVVDDYDVVMTSSISGFYFTGCTE